MKLEQTDNITAMAIDCLYTVQNNEVIFSILFIKMFNNDQTVIYEPSARRHFSRISALFEARATKERVLHLLECAEYVFVHRGLYNIF
jgi:hypothetical protein